MTRVRLAAVATVLVTAVTSGALSSAARADCTNEVQQAFARQSNSDMVRKTMNLIGEQGPFKMVIEFVRPDRMRQVVTTTIEPDKPVETVLVGKTAWSRIAGGEFKQLSDGETEQVIAFMKGTIADAPSNVGLFECMGAETQNGLQVRAYKGLPPEETKPDFGAALPKKDAAKKPAGEAPPKNEAVRVVYIDTATSLPRRIIFAKADMLDKPIFQESYDYPTDIKIDAPSVAKP